MAGSFLNTPYMYSLPRLIFLCFLLTGSLYAQQGSFRSLSVVADQDGCSTEEYAKLATSLRDRSTTLSSDEWRCIYYGSTRLSTYSPYAEEKTAEAVGLLRLRKKDNDETLATTGYLLRHNPAFLDMYYHQTKSASRLGRTRDAQRAMDRYMQLLDVPLASGDGLTPATAYRIRALRDSDHILRLLGLEEVLSEATVWTVDNIPFLHVTANNYYGQAEERYFNLYYPFVVGQDKLVAKSGRKRLLK